MTGLTLRKIGKSYGSVEVLSDVSLDIKNGEFIAFLGPSGCGKTTLLRMIAGLERIDRGTITLGGRDIGALRPGARGVAMVFQSYALYPHMSVFNNIAFGLRNVGIARDEVDVRVREAARVLELEALLDRKPDQLSGGQRQRVAIARTVVKHPQVYLYDEPLSNLDAALRVRTRVELARLHQRQNGISIFVTHDQVEAMTLAHRIVVMRGGGIEQVGTPQEIYRRPRTVFVATFVGSPAMNLLDCPVSESSGNCAASVLGETLHTTIAHGPWAKAGGVRLGIRPDAMRPTVDGRFSGVVEIIERLGDRSHLYLRAKGGESLVIEAPGEFAAQAGVAVRFDLDVNRVSLFDHEGLAHHPVAELVE